MQDSRTRKDMQFSWKWNCPEQSCISPDERSGRTERQFGVSKLHTLLDSKPLKRGRKALNRTFYFIFTAGQFAVVIRA